MSAADPNNPPASSSSSQQEDAQERFNEYVAEYPVEVKWPPEIVAVKEDRDGSTSTVPNTRTSTDLIHHRLIEAGVLPEVPTPLNQILMNLNEFVQDMQTTTNNCFHSVKVELDYKDGEEASQEDGAAPTPTMNIELHEKNWYSLHIGGSLLNNSTNDVMMFNNAAASSATTGPLGLQLPTAEFNVSAGLRNLTGACDATHASYTLDTNQMAALLLSHDRPLYSVLPTNSVIQNSLLLLPTGSQYALSTRAFWKHVDYELVRAASYQEYQRGAVVQIASSNLNQPGQPYYSLSYQAILRDIIPKRLATDDNHSGIVMNASVPIVKQAGPTLKHSITAQVRQNGSQLDNAQLPTEGTDWNVDAELALPVYSDVSFVKLQGNWAHHTPLAGGLALHGLVKGGYLHALEPQKLPTVSDRFYLGGPLNFRGFLPAGIGPRATKGAAGSTDALGGDFYYTATAMASFPLGGNSPAEPSFLDSIPMRAFVFGTVGTCVGSLQHVVNTTSNPALALWQSSRASVGMGLATNVLGNTRLELTYSLPLRYGPTDHRRNVQVGMSLHLDQ